MSRWSLSCYEENGTVSICKIKKYNIVCLQDTYINKKLEAFIKAEWGYEAYFSSYVTNSRGVMVLINNNFEQEVKRIKTDKMAILLF